MNRIEKEIRETRYAIKAHSEQFTNYMRSGTPDMMKVQEYTTEGNRLAMRLRNLEESDYKAVKVKTVFTDLEEAIRNSSEVYGLSEYGKQELFRRLKLHEKYRVQEYYLDHSGNVWYVVTVPHEPGRILHKFSWASVTASGPAFIAEVDESKIKVFTKKYVNRDTLRYNPKGLTWTTESIN